MNTENLDAFYYFIGNISVYMFFLAFIGMILHIFKKGFVRIVGTKISLGLVTFIITSLVFITVFITINIVQLHALNEVKSILNEPIITIKINNKNVDSITQHKVISQLKGMNRKMPHNSHPTSRIILDIYSKKDSIQLEIRKDSEFDNEYWLYWKKYHATKKNSFARVKTKVFENIN